jgi:predicted metal-binding membrane protein
MATLFALGVMSLTWTIVIAAVIAVEKVLPWKRGANVGVVLLLIVLALGVALVPNHVPGLTIPADAGMPMDGAPTSSMGH